MKERKGKSGVNAVKKKKSKSRWSFGNFETKVWSLSPDNLSYYYSSGNWEYGILLYIGRRNIN